MHRAASLLIVLFAVGCATASSSRPASVAQPDVSVELAHPIFFGTSSTAAVTLDVAIRNRASVPIRVRRIEIDSPGMAQYGLQRGAREFRETIAPGEEETLVVFATAVTNTSRPSEPLTVRVIAHFEAEGATWREMIHATVGVA